MNANNDTQRESNNAVINGAKIQDFGQKIGGARKDLYTAANEWAAQLAGITADALTQAGGVSKLVHLPNLEKLTEAGAINADQARAALVIWRGIERKPQGSYRAGRWAERTRARLEAAAAIITGTEPAAADVAEVIRAARESAEMEVLNAANWPAVAFSFGKYGAIRSYYSDSKKLYISTGDRRYYPHAYADPADLVARIREMVANDEAKAADRRAAGPALGVYMNRAGVYYIAPTEHAEIVLQTYETRADAWKAYDEDRAALVERYAALKNFPECRRDWNRPRVGEDWRNGENMTPEKFAAVLPFRGVEFGNWVNQTERAALLNSAFDGFHDLAAVLNIAPAAVTLNGSLAFAFASRGHSKAAAHYESARRVINLTKKSGAGCMAHEWFHAVDNFAAGGRVNNFATENADHSRAYAILQAIKKTAFYTRSKNLAQIKGKYWIEGCELTARAFEGVCAVMLNAAGICSDFLVNCKTMDEFTAEDVASRSDYYPYPTADEAAALLPLYVDFLREVFGEVLTAPAACYEEARRAAERAEKERKEYERIAAERAEAEQKERERKAQERAEQAAREAEAKKQAAAYTLDLMREVLTARHFDAIATGYDSVTAYAVAHLEGELYTMRADIQTANTEGRSYVEQLPAAIIQYKRIHNAKRIICRRYRMPEIHANSLTARELVEGLSISDTRAICCAFDTFEKADTWQKAAHLWDDTQRMKAEQAARAEKAAKSEGRKADSDRATGAPAAGLHLEEIAGGVRVIGDDWKDTYFNKKAIKANGGTWNKEAKQWEATDPADVARLRAWFALREQTTAPAAPASLEQADDITAGTESTPIYNTSEKSEIPAITANRLTPSDEPEPVAVAVSYGSEPETPDAVPAAYYSGSEKSEACSLYYFSFKNRTAEQWTCLTRFKTEADGKKWLQHAAKGVGALSVSACDFLDVQADYIIYFSSRNGDYICMYLADFNGQPLRRPIEELRGRLLDARKAAELKQIAQSIQEADRDGCAYEIHAGASVVRVDRDPRTPGHFRATWYVSGELDERRKAQTAEDAAGMVWLLRESCALEGKTFYTQRPQGCYRYSA